MNIPGLVDASFMMYLKHSHRVKGSHWKENLVEEIFIEKKKSESHFICGRFAPSTGHLRLYFDK